uniref:Filamentous hemagglutinin n=1 Tax=Desertifilum tharense IPPAS B-1220 TaxID=1781255 RepID=A0ACD5GMJ2_9CYAN
MSPLLTLNTPIGLQFGSNAGAIAVQDDAAPSPIPSQLESLSGLQVSPGNTLALLGNGITLVSGNVNSLNGSIELGSVQSGTVSFSPTLNFDYSQVEAFNDIQLTQQSQIIGVGIGGTTINLQGRNIQIAEGSTLLIANRGSLEGDRLSVNATELLSLSGTNRTRTNGSRIVTNTATEGKGGDVTISARQAIVEDGGQIATQTDGSGVGGNLSLRVSESLFVNGTPSAVFTLATSIATVSSGAGESGHVTVSAQQLQVLNGGTIGSSVFGLGDGGDVQINVSDSIEVSGVNSLSLLPSSLSTSTIGWGNAGNLDITTAKLAVREGSLVSSSTGGVANAGNLTIRASEWIEVSGVAPGSFLSSGLGSNALILDPISRAAYRLPDVPTGDAGGVSLIAPQLRVLDRAEVGVKNDGTGNAGNFEVHANTIILNNGGAITAETQSGNGGNLLLSVQERLQMRNNSRISVEAGGAGDGGNITIESPVILGWENSDITANAIQGNGGNIQVTAQGILGLQFRDRPTPGNDITASSEFGVSGTVRINTLDVEPSAGLVELPANPVDPTQQIVVGCADTRNNRFVVTGRGGVPENPSQRVILDRAWVDVRTLSSDRAPLAQSPSAPESLVEAVGWYRNPQGSIELVGTTSSTRGSSLSCLKDAVPQTSSNLHEIPSERSPEL